MADEPLRYREPYPTWILIGMDVLAAGILVASFRDAWSVVRALGSDADDWTNKIVAGAVVLAIDASVLLLEQARSQIKLRGGDTRYNDIWVIVLIVISAMLNVRYLTTHGEMIDRIIGAVLGIAIPSTIAVLGYLKGDMLAYNARCRQDSAVEASSAAGDAGATPSAGAAGSSAGDDAPTPLFRLHRPAS